MFPIDRSTAASVGLTNVISSPDVRRTVFATTVLLRVIRRRRISVGFRFARPGHDDRRRDGRVARSAGPTIPSRYTTNYTPPENPSGGTSHRYKFMRQMFENFEFVTRRRYYDRGVVGLFRKRRRRTRNSLPGM